MQFHQLDDVIAGIEAIGSLFRELLAREQELDFIGFRRVQDWDTYKKAEPFLVDFDAHFSDLLDFARATDRDTWQALSNVATTNKLADTLSSIYVRLRLEIERRPVPSDVMFGFVRVLTLLMRIRQRYLFSKSDSEIPIHQALVTLHRLVPLTKRIRQLYLEKLQIDDRVFRPSHIDRVLVIQHIENTIVNVQSASLNQQEKTELLSYLENIKLELTSRDVSWKKVVGALVIVATLLSGINDTPGALENISKAIQHILGASVEKHIPPRLLFLPDASGGTSV